MAESSPTSSHLHHAAFKELLFGDVPLESWGPNATGVPWTLFAEARAALAKGDSESAFKALGRVAFMEGLESRHHLQAWHAARQLGIRPRPGDAKRVLGVVVEMPMGPGFDILACYADHTARYLNHAGRMVIIESPLPMITPLIDCVIEASKRVVEATVAHDGPRPAGPPVGQARISFLTPSGLHFGQGSAEALARNALVGPVIAAATRLLQGLIKLDQG